MEIIKRIETKVFGIKEPPFGALKSLFLNNSPRNSEGIETSWFFVYLHS